MAPHRDRRLNAIGGFDDALMLPYDQYVPALAAEQSFCLFIAFDVSCQLLLPPRTVCLRFRCVERAAVPEASADIYDEPCADKHDVMTPTASADDWAVHKIAKPAPVELSPKS
jgi:hypothetical protein